MFTRLIQIVCFLALLVTQSTFCDKVYIVEDEEFPLPRSKHPPQVVTKCYTPRLCHFVIPTGVAAIGLAMGSYKATENRDECVPTPETPTPPEDVLDFFVEAHFNNISFGLGSITLEIKFPNMSLLDTMMLSTPTIGTVTELSNATTNFSSGDQFTVDVISISADDGPDVNYLEVKMRINGIDIIGMAQAGPTTSTSFVFTIP